VRNDREGLPSNDFDGEKREIFFNGPLVKIPGIRPGMQSIIIQFLIPLLSSRRA